MLRQSINLPGLMQFFAAERSLIPAGYPMDNQFSFCSAPTTPLRTGRDRTCRRLRCVILPELEPRACNPYETSYQTGVLFPLAGFYVLSMNSDE